MSASKPTVPHPKRRQLRAKALSSLVVGLVASAIAIWWIGSFLVSEESKLLMITIVILTYTILVIAIDYWETGRNLHSVVEKLGEIGMRMGVVAEDIERRNQFFPNLTARFITANQMSRSITIPRGATSTVEIILGNEGAMSALNTRWQLFFPPGLSVQAPQGNVLIYVQPPYAYYPGYTGVKYPAAGVADMVGPKSAEQIIRLDLTPSVGPSKLIVPVNGQCTNHPQIVTELEVEVQ